MRPHGPNYLASSGATAPWRTSVRRATLSGLIVTVLAAVQPVAAVTPTPTPPPADPWGLDRGRTWTEQAGSPTPSADDWWHETGGAPGGGSSPHGTPPPGATPPGGRATPAPGPPGPTPGRTTLDLGAGPYHEFAALCRLGWASSLARHSVGAADGTIAEHLRMAGAHLRAANRTTFDPLRAWPDWAARRGYYDSLADRLPGAGDVFRRQLAQELETGWGGLVDDLAWQLAGELQHRETCDSHYARLGYTLCSGQQSLQIAAVAEREGDRELMQRTAREGRDRLGLALRELEALPRVPLATGRCVDLEPVRRLLTTFPGRGGLPAEVEIANAVFDETLRLLAGAAGGQSPVRLASVSASGWTWGANLNIAVLLTPDQRFIVTRVRRCLADWSPNPQQCQAQTRSRSVAGEPRSFCCTGDWLSGKITVPGQGTVTITWPHGPQNRVPIPAGVTVDLGTLYMLAATQGDFDHDAAFALIEGVDAGGRAVEIESPVFTPRDRFPSYEAMCRQVGSAMSR